MEYALLKMKQSYSQDKIKAKWIYIIKSKGNYTPASINVVNGFFNDGIQKLQVGDTDWSAFNLQTVRVSLIYKMYDSGCSLEEISYLIGAPISGMLQPDIINGEMIRKAGEKSWKNGAKSGQSKHPFNKTFDQ